MTSVAVDGGGRQGGCLPRLRKKSGILTLIMLVLVVVCYVILLKFNIDEAKQRTISSKYTSQDATVQVADANGIIKTEAKMRVEIRVLKVDLVNSVITSQIAFFPSSILSKDRRRLDVPLVAYFTYYQKAYPVNATMAPVEATFPILSGSTSYYPFDEFYTEISVEIIDLNTGIRIPTVVRLKASVPSLKFDIARTTQELQNGGESDEVVLNPNQEIDVDGEIQNYQQKSVASYKFTLRVTRPLTIILFSLFVIAAMWILSLVMVGVAFTIFFLVETRPEGGYLALGSGLLFALPYLRNAQPDVPPIGVIIDAFGFIWNMILVAMSCSLIIMVWIRRRYKDITFA